MSSRADETERVREALRKKYADELLIEEFSSPIGSRPYKHADAVGIWLHPSRGNDISYYEIKASRSDWLNELDHPGKSDPVAKYCDRIWLVTTDESVARYEEIPETWGWMVLRGKRFNVLKQAPKMNPVWDRDFIVRVAQYSQRAFHSTISQIESDAYKYGREQAERFNGREALLKQAEKQRKKLSEYHEKLDMFHQETGISQYGDAEYYRRILSVADKLVDIERERGRLDLQKLGQAGYNLQTIKETIAKIEALLSELK